MNKLRVYLMSAVISACPLTSSQYVDINVPYYGLDHQQHVGTLIVNKNTAAEVRQIFKTIDNAKFPIAKIKPLSAYPNEEVAMLDNDTFALSCRFISNTNIISNHSFGIAIDINPVFNPYVRGNVVMPANSLPFTYRNMISPGMITANGIVVRAFSQYGWHWGGNWKSLKDYQHFEKYLPTT